MPDLSDNALIADADRLFSPWLIKATCRKDIEALDLLQVLTGELGWQGKQLLDTFAPQSYGLVSGREVNIDYSVPSPHVSVRVQELYGLSEHPTIADGQVALVFELLSPAQRPIQTTSDLPGFWSGSWTEVRKEMKGRYPKHNWPENPSEDVS